MLAKSITPVNIAQNDLLVFCILFRIWIKNDLEKLLLQQKCSRKGSPCMTNITQNDLLVFCILFMHPDMACQISLSDALICVQRAPEIFLCTATNT